MDAGNARRAIVTGAVGDIGSATVASLAEAGIEVHAVDVPEARVEGIADAPDVDQHGVTGVDDLADQLVEDREASA